MEYNYLENSLRVVYWNCETDAQCTRYFRMHILFGTTERIKLLFSIKNRGGFAIYILLICTILCIYNKNFDLLIYFLPLIIWWLLLMLSMPISITRYIIIFVISFPLILCLTLSTKKQ